jgi:hypothetical protein
MLIHMTREEWEQRRMAIVASGKLSSDGSKAGKLIVFPLRTDESLSHTLWAF